MINSFSGVDVMGRYLSVLLFLVGLSACEVTSHTNDEYYELATALTKLSAAVESAVRYKNPPKGLSDQELIAFSVQHDPSLTDAFDGYVVKASMQDRHALLLVCEDESLALLEDLGCSKELDSHRWKEPGECQFALSAQQCAQ